MRYALFTFLIVSSFLCASSQNKKGKEIKYTNTFHVFNIGALKRTLLTLALPPTIPGQQVVKEIKFSQEPDTTFVSNGIKYAYFSWETPQPEEKIVMDVVIETFRCGLNTMTKQKTNQEETPEMLAPFLCEEKFVEINDPLVLNTAKQLAGKNTLSTLKNIYGYLTKEIRYASFNKRSAGAKMAIVHKRGDCTEFTDLFIALCRANNIPAKSVHGMVTDAPSYEFPFHAWAEVYIDEIGWVPFEATSNYKPNFGWRANRYVHLFPVRTGCLNYNHTAYRYKSWGGKVVVRREVTFH